MTIIEAIAERIAAINYADLPSEAVDWAKAAILDTVGVTLAGAGEECARIVERVLVGVGGECLIFGGNRRAAPFDAALINGTASHALDFDDVSNSLGGHPSAPILPALFALGEILDCTGRDFIAAYVAGLILRPASAAACITTITKGWHPTATLGVFGATAACCHLMGRYTNRPTGPACRDGGMDAGSESTVNVAVATPLNATAFAPVKLIPVSST